MQIVKRLIFILTLMVSCSAFAHHTSQEPQPGIDSQPTPPPSPWFTGPLLAPTGHVFPAGQVGFEPYLFYTDDFGHYNTRWVKVSTLQTETVNPVMVIFYGLTSRSDLQVTVPYLFNFKGGVQSHGFSDATVTLGYQALTDVPHTWMPDLKLTIAETFPSGRYENLNPALNGTDSLGAGSFQTAVAGTFQKLLFLPNGKFLRGRLNFTVTVPAHVKLSGFNAYGGAANTLGTIALGDHMSTDLAFEYTMTRHWVPAIDFLYVVSDKNTFTGFAGTMAATGLPAPIFTQSAEIFSIAPAMEYNFNGSVGLIVGVWFTVTGRNATDFVSGVFALDISL